MLKGRCYELKHPELEEEGKEIARTRGKWEGHSMVSHIHFCLLYINKFGILIMMKSKYGKYVLDKKGRGEVRGVQQLGTDRSFVLLSYTSLNRASFRK